MVSPNVEISNWYELLKSQALGRNEKSVGTWTRYKSDLEETKSLLSYLPKKVKHDVMVPIGPKALMRGKIVHTNEYLVNLGETWFASRTAHQAIEICDRRIKNCDEVLKKLETEKQLIVNKSTLPAQHEAFGNEERPEIIEFVTEEENEEWKKQHRLREKKYRQQLADMRNKEKKKIQSEEDLWKHLDELEAQEELEDELNRLHAECSSEEDLPEEDSEPKRTSTEEIRNVETEANENLVETENQTAKNCKPERRVSFACDYKSSDEEPLRLEIRHSNIEPVQSDPNSREITSPSDIYNQYIKLNNKQLKSVLKKSVNYNEINNCAANENLNVEDSDTDESSESEVTSTRFQIKDVIERPYINADKSVKPDSAIKKISKFKAMRMKNN